MIRLKFCILCLYIIDLAESIEVLTTLGPIKGRQVNDELTGASFYSFEGIPYAEPPMGNLRFKPPIRKRQWCDVLDATKPGRVCPQSEVYHSRKEMDEDCLNLNIYTPAIRSNELIPVLFNIHGGDFDSQSGNAEPLHGPQFLMLQNIIVVTMNYRLGALGFLSLCNEEISGNAGLKDVLLALEIIHENIINFGGNPNKITVRGSGAGAVLAGYIMLTDRCSGLVQNVQMLHSGSFLSTKYTQMDPIDNAKLLARYLGLNTTNYSDMIEQFKHVDAFEFVKAQEAMSQNDSRRVFRQFKPFKLTIEMDSPSALIRRPALDLLREGAICDVPVFVGFNNQEGLEIFPQLRKEPHLIYRLNENMELLIPQYIKYPKESEEAKYVAARINYFYFNLKHITIVEVQKYINLISDTLYTYSIDLFVKLFKEKKTAPVYYYVFGNDNKLNWFKEFNNITYPGAAHFDDHGYVFVTSMTKTIYPYLDSNDKKGQELLMRNLKYFLYYGATPADVSWPEAGENRSHLYITEYGAIPVFHAPLRKRIAFWNSIYNEYFNSKYNTATYYCTKDNIQYQQ